LNWYRIWQCDCLWFSLWLCRKYVVSYRKLLHDILCWLKLLISTESFNYCSILHCCSQFHFHAYEFLPCQLVFICDFNFIAFLLPSVLWRCWLGGRKGIWPVKTEWWGAGMVVCLGWDADLHMAQLMPLPLTVSCLSKIQIGFTFLVLAYPGSPRKGPLNVCVCVHACVRACVHVCVRVVALWQKC